MWSAFSRFGGLVAARVARRQASAVPSVGLGIALGSAAFLLFSSMDVLIKWLSSGDGGYPIHQLLFVNALFSLLPVGVAAWQHGGMVDFKTSRLGLHLLRGLFGMAASFAAFTGFSLMPMADVYAILFATPLLITALSVPLLGEQVGWRRWSAVIVGFAGVMIMLQPGAGMIGLGTIAAIAAAAASCFSIILVRKLSATETTASIALYPNLLIVAVMGAWLLVDFRPMPLVDILIAGLAGMAGGGALLCLVGAYRRAPAAVVAPFQYSQMVWGVIYRFLIFGDLPGAGVVVGGSIVIASGLFILYREIRLAKAPPEIARTPVPPAVPMPEKAIA
jgi:drug/metabolite transporter (DMT)-like permease